MPYAAIDSAAIPDTGTEVAAAGAHLVILPTRPRGATSMLDSKLPRRHRRRPRRWRRLGQVDVATRVRTGIMR